MGLKELEEEHTVIMGQIKTLQMESIRLPHDIALAHSTRRHELLKLVHRKFTQAEVESTLDAFAGEMELLSLYKRLADVKSEIISSLIGKISQAQVILKYDPK